MEGSWVQMDGKEILQKEKSNKVYLTEWFCVAYREEVHERYKGTFDIFFGIDHRMRKEEMDEPFNKEAKQGWRSAADAARITDETAGSKDRKHTSGGVSVAVDSNLGAFIGKEEGTFTSIPGNERRIAQTWLTV